MKKILLIDDKKDNLTVLKAIIKDAFPAAVVFTALDGPAGIALAREHDPDVILLDILMPDMDGFEVCRLMKSDGSLGDIPVVFITAAKCDTQSRIEALETGAEAFLSKPVDPAELTAQIRAMVKIKAAARQKLNERGQLESLVAKRTAELEKTQLAMLNLMEDLKAEIERRKVDEEKIRNLLREKELILKEVHHRIKNNMNTVFSILILHSEEQENPFVKNILNDAASRVQSVMVLYDKLYLSETGGTIPVKEYLPALVNEIANVFVHKKYIEIKTEMQDFNLSAKILSSLGVIINELITNAMKYAFKDRTSGVIKVAAFKNEKKVSIIFEDDGCGLPETVTFDNKSGFGLKLLSMMVRQLNGIIAVERLNGTKFTISFET